MKRFGILVREAFKGELWKDFLTSTEHCGFEAIDTLVLSQLTGIDDGRESFSECCRWLSRLLDGSDEGRLSRSTVVLTDLSGSAMTTPFNLDPCSRMDAGRRILGMLILTFPEVHWAIEGVVTLSDERGFWRTAHLLPLQVHDQDRSSRTNLSISDAIELRRIGYTPLFDGSGLRNILRRAIVSHSGSGRIPTRDWCAAALDDEANYALLHAYSAYRFGLRAIPVCTFALARRLFGDETKQLRNVALNLQIVFEDVFLALPDGLTGLSDLSGSRQKHLPGLEDLAHRIFVTLGKRQPDEAGKWSRNRDYLALQRQAVENVRIVNKPHAGIFGFWHQSSLGRIRWQDSDGVPHRGTGEGFVWPPANLSLTASEAGHSAPGVVELVASSLVERALRMFSAAGTIEDAVVGAVLATDALELLAAKVPTTSLDALRLKHQFEVLIECQFSGAEYDLELRPRLAEITLNVEKLCEGFHPANRENAALSAEIKILNGVLLIFRSNAQYEAEQTCVNRIRHLRGRLWMAQGALRKAAWPIIRYVELLLSSFPTFLCALGLWLVGLGLLYAWMGADRGLAHGFEDALTSFFSIGAPIHAGASDQPLSTGYVCVVCLAVVSGFVHLGLFISHLYSLVARK